MRNRSYDAATERSASERSATTECAALVDRAVSDAAGQTGLDPTQVEVISVVAVDWPNSALGCPEPGQAYAQVITPGFAIVVDAAGTRLSYHTDRSDRLIACEGDPLPEI